MFEKHQRICNSPNAYSLRKNMITTLTRFSKNISGVAIWQDHKSSFRNITDVLNMTAHRSSNSYKTTLQQPTIVDTCLATQLMLWIFFVDPDDRLFAIVAGLE